MPKSVTMALATSDGAEKKTTTFTYKTIINSCNENTIFMERKLVLEENECHSDPFVK